MDMRIPSELTKLWLIAALNCTGMTNSVMPPRSCCWAKCVNGYNPTDQVNYTRHAA